MLERLAGARSWVRWTVSLAAFAAVVTTVDVAQVMAEFSLRGWPPLSAARLWGLGWIEWLCRGLLIPAALAASRRFPVDGDDRRLRNVSIHLGIAIAGPPLVIAASIPAMIPQLRMGVPGNATGALDVFINTELYLLSRYLLPTMAMYAVVVGGHHAWMYQQRLREAHDREIRLEGMLDAARLSSLRAQIRPHFLFNTLNAITVLARRGEGEKVAETTMFLAEMLRLSLASEEQLVPLSDELRLVEAYLRVEGVRFDERLGVRWALDGDIMDLLVPAFILQPLVENAVRHGAAPRRERTTIAIGAKRLDQRLHLWVEDDGAGMDGLAAPRGRGIGLGHTRERLAHLYGEDQSLRVRTARGRGFRVDVLIPLAGGNGTAAAPRR